MKRLLLLFGTMVLLVSGSAQTLDTIDSRYDGCYYTRWYDTCTAFLNGQDVVPNVAGILGIGKAIYAFPHYTDTPIQIKGGLAMVLRQEDYRRALGFQPQYWGFPRVPEYVLLYQYNESKDEMILLDSARWDTLPPKLMRLPLNSTFDSFFYCYAYEAFFDSPVTVDSTFCIGVTTNNNDSIAFYAYYHIPTFYSSVALEPCNGCPSYDMFAWLYNQEIWEQFRRDDPFWRPSHDGWYFGGVLPLADMNNLDTQVDDEDAGMVSGGGRYARNTYHEITAIPNPGYRFYQWNDSVLSATRTVELLQDTQFTAYFLGNDFRSVQAVSANDSLGTVSGGGFYREGVTVTLTATAANHYYFDRWSDGDTANPRRFVVDQDTLFTAYFQEKAIHSVEATSANALQGTVEGSGYYYEDETVTLTAMPAENFRFWYWSDGDMSNPRTLVVKQDTLLTAVFAQVPHLGMGEAGEPTFGLQPNPAHGSFTLVVAEQLLAGGEPAVLTMNDGKGATVLQQRITEESTTIAIGHLAAGVYYVTLHTQQGSTTQKLAVK